jgi:hypothetical protein
MPPVPSPLRRTIVVPNAFALRAERYRLAQAGSVGTAVMTFEHLAARLAGGFLQVATSLDIAAALEAALDGPLGELESIAHLPGFRRAAAATLSKAWSAGLKLSELAMSEALDASIGRRYQALALLEVRILSALPPSLKPPAAIAEAARARSSHAPQLFGIIDVQAHTELHPVWRPLLLDLASLMPVRWIAGPSHIPDWLGVSAVSIQTALAEDPERIAEVCANPRHEVLEAFRWARSLITEHGVAPGDIAFAAAAPMMWDEHVAALRTVSDLPVHVAHGERAVWTAEGQAAAALAELLLNGVSRSRLLRFIRLDPAHRGADVELFRATFADSPLLDWSHVRAPLEACASALDTDALRSSLERFRAIVDTLEPGIVNAEAARELLPPLARPLWDRALLDGPPEALAISLDALRTQPVEEVSPEHAVLWCSAAVLASQPRPYTRLLGLTSRAWPRFSGDDPLLPAHIIDQRLLDPLPVHLADRRDLASIFANTRVRLVFSRARRNSDGRLNGVSPLWPRNIPATHLSALRAAPHAASFADRNLLRLDDFAHEPLTLSAQGAWLDWRSPELTAHDGLMPAGHPLLVRALDRVQSATSLQRLLRDPLAYLWTYGFRWKIDDEIEEPFTLDARLFGTLVHEILERALSLEGAERSAAAAEAVAIDWEAKHPLPPPILWRATITSARKMAADALAEATGLLDRVWGEVLFGSRAGENTGDGAPWDPTQPVEIGATGIRIGGRIDRLELSADGRRARVTDYKTGKAFPSAKMCVNGGAELQRCLYAYAVHSLLPEVEEIEPRLLYPAALLAGKPLVYPLPDPEGTLESVAGFVAEARSLLLSGATLPSILEIESADFAARDETFALPAGAQYDYLRRKREAILERLAVLAPLWEMP